MRPNGTQVELLIAAPGMISSVDPQVSHDGKTLLFCGMPTPVAATQGRIYAYALRGSFQGTLRDFGWGINPSWSPDDRHVAYLTYEGNPIGAKEGIWIMDADGTNRRWLVSGLVPRWSPDGKYLICHDYSNASRDDILLVDVENGASRPLLKSKGWHLKNYGAEWSLDGRKLVFAGEFAGNDHIATIGLRDDDQVEILYTNIDKTVELLGPPVYSPDGRQIVFIEQEAGKPNAPRLWWHSYLYSMPADGSAAPTSLEGKKLGNINRGPAFLPDGSKLLFSSERYSPLRASRRWTLCFAR